MCCHARKDSCLLFLLFLDAVKEHLHLISEAMPGWLSFIKITKGEYITMDKKKDINVLLGNLK